MLQDTLRTALAPDSDDARRERAETRREAAIAYLKCRGIYRGEHRWCDHAYRPGPADWLRHKGLAVSAARVTRGEARVLALLRGSVA